MNKTTCQICARDIKATTGVIAHHGYQRPGNGYQSSSCLGARQLPYEVSRDFIPEAIGQYQVWLDHQLSRIDELSNNPPATITRFARSSFEKNEELGRPEGFDAKVNIAGDVPYHLITPYHSEHRRQVREAGQNAEHLRQDIQWLQQRYENWKAA